jgi:hypothetical protein
MNEIEPLVTEAMLAECRAKLEAPSIYGAQYKVAGPPVPSLRYSCAQRVVNALIEHKTLGYAIPMVRVTGMAEFWDEKYDAACIIKKSSGAAYVDVATLELKVHSMSPCHSL